MFLRGGLGGIIVIGAIIYFSGAGSWLMTRVQALDEQCYVMLTDVGFTEANPACAALGSGLSAVDGMLVAVGDKIDGFKQNVFGTTSFDDLSQFAADMQLKMQELSSSGDDLARMVSAGPQGLSGLGLPPFQQAIDSFSIGQNYLKKDGMSAQGLSWLQLGASQPQGYGVMSQLSLGNVYARGAYGVPANPAMAQYYLKQATSSLAVLSSSNTPQSQQILGALPATPDQMRRAIEHTLQQLQMVNR